MRIQKAAKIFLPTHHFSVMADACPLVIIVNFTMQAVMGHIALSLLFTDTHGDEHIIVLGFQAIFHSVLTWILLCPPCA
jgi:hypothetical protein